MTKKEALNWADKAAHDPASVGVFYTDADAAQVATEALHVLLVENDESD